MKQIVFGLLTVLLSVVASASAQTNQTIQELMTDAGKGDAEAQLSLGLHYYSGNGVTNDNVQAVNWVRKSAEQNLASAQSFLGVCYRDGIGVAKNQAEAVKWYRKAAEQNNADAQYELGCAYYNGTGIETNFLEAAKWIRKAAEQNQTDAQNNLGVSYVYGMGVMKDFVEGYKWLDLASAKGSETSKKLMSALENRMTPEQIAEGQKLAREFKPHKASVFGNFNSPENFATNGTVNISPP